MFNRGRVLLDSDKTRDFRLHKCELFELEGLRTGLGLFFLSMLDFFLLLLNEVQIVLPVVLRSQA
jgi:hypothetical protein